MTKTEKLSELIGKLPRVTLAQLPTPLQKLNNLSKELGGPQIYMKRDDLTGIALGGNKTRMMEFRMPPPLEEGADILVSGFGIQSNQARQIVASAKKFGLDVYLVSRHILEDEEFQVQGNLLIDLLAGATVEIVEATIEEHERLIEEKAEELKAQGKSPYITGYDDNDLSAVSYVNCGVELQEQIQGEGIAPDYLYLSSEGATQAGLLLFSQYTNQSWELKGVSPIDWIPDIPARVSNTANEAAKALGLDFSVSSRTVNNSTSYVGKGYAKPTEGCLEAIKLVAQTEGILLDPVYTGKAMACLIDDIRSGDLDEHDSVIFLHTGGFPALFCYNEDFDFDEHQLNVKL